MDKKKVKVIPKLIKLYKRVYPHIKALFLNINNMISTEKCSPNNNKFKFINLNLYNNKHRICG